MSLEKRNKVCNKCRQDKQLSEYNRCRTNPDGYQYTCRPCQVAYRRERREYFAKYSRDYYEENKERCQATVKKYQQKNSEVIAERKGRWYSENSERVKDRVRSWSRSNPEKVREYGRRKKARRLNQLGYFPSWLVNYYRYLQQDLCFYCREDISDAYQVEHLTPLSRGGLHCWNNTVLSCQECNYRKHTKTLEEFTQ